ncbi:DsbA family protein [Halovulum sp. GXIMD14793]
MTYRSFTRRQALWTAAAAGLAASSGSAVFAQSREAVDMVKGNADAPVTVVEYASFTCPHCRTFHTQTFPKIRENFIETGKVKFILREVYFDRFGLWAGMIARCAGPERYFGVVDMIFDKQAEWLSGGDPSVIVENLKSLGRQAGLTNAEMDACLQDEDFAKALVEAYQKNATADQIEATPTLLINGEKQPNLPYGQLETLLNAALSASDAAPDN